jgi:hypothetical protein
VGKTFPSFRTVLSSGDVNRLRGDILSPTCNSKSGVMQEGGRVARHPNAQATEKQMVSRHATHTLAEGPPSRTLPLPVGLPPPCPPPWCSARWGGRVVPVHIDVSLSLSIYIYKQEYLPIRIHFGSSAAHKHLVWQVRVHAKKCQVSSWLSASLGCARVGCTSWDWLHSACCASGF